MKKYVLLVTTLTLGLLCIVMVTKGIAWAQEPAGDKQAAVWSSSVPIPEGTPCDSPPDRPAKVDAAETAAAATYDAYLRISGAALKPRESNVEWRGAGGGGSIYAESGNTSAVFNAPVYLPQGAMVKYIRMYYNDTNATNNCIGWFTVYDLYGDVVEEWPLSSSGSAGEGYVMTGELTHGIDYSLYSYVVNWRPYELGSDMQLCGFRIYYHTPPPSGTAVPASIGMYE